MSQEKNIYVIRSAGFSYFARSAFPFGLGVYRFFGAGKGSLSDRLEFLVTGVIVGVFMCAWIASYKVIVTSESLTYEKLFLAPRTVRFEDISKVARHFGLKQNATSLDGMDRLIIWTNWSTSRSKEAYIVINLKVFKSEDVKLLVDTLKPYM